MDDKEKERLKKKAKEEAAKKKLAADRRANPRAFDKKWGVGKSGPKKKDN